MQTLMQSKHLLLILLLFFVSQHSILSHAISKQDVKPQRRTRLLDSVNANETTNGEYEEAVFYSFDDIDNMMDEDDDINALFNQLDNSTTDISGQQPCNPNAAKSPLCGSSEVIAYSSGTCKNEVIELGSVEPCCEVQTVLSDPCHVDDGYAKCRTATLMNGMCSANAAACDAISLKISLEVVNKEGTCCETCSCYGDPHCESFSGTVDTWLLCDARERSSTNPSKCSITKNACSKQKDHNGNTCVWRSNPNGAAWNFGLQGSQCSFDTVKSGYPEMVMYKADDFKLTLRLGERGIILQTRIIDNNKLYILNADDCWDDYLKNQKNPWRADDTSFAPLADPDWLPNRWLGTVLPGGDRLWSVFGLKSAIKVNIRCTRNMVTVAGKRRYGPTRLNIEEIVEPLNPANRTEVAGFCVENGINKGKSTAQVTENFENMGACNEDGAALAIARYLCSKGVTESSLPACKESWCKSRRVDWEKCVLDIGRFGWARTWCASHVLLTSNPLVCTSGDCRKCISDILDFGWSEAIDKWSNYKVLNHFESESNATCITVDQLPSTLSPCQKGIEIQYEKSPGIWVTVKAVPDQAKMCNSVIELLSQDPLYQPLFSNPIRIKQCSLDATCQQDPCTPEMGFKAKFAFENPKANQPSLVSLIQNNDLVCNPAKYPNNKLGCLKIKPPKACPCK